MTSTRAMPEKVARKESRSTGTHKFTDLIKDFCLKLKYNGKTVIKHLFDNNRCSAFRVNWYEETPNNSMITSERIVASHFIVIDLSTMEIKIKENTR